MKRETKTIAVLGTRGFPGVQGGVETHCQHLYPLMPQLHFRVYRRKPYLTDQSQASYDNIDFIDWPSTRIQGLEAAWHTLRAALHCMRHRPALVHVHNMGPAVLALPVKLVGIPVVMTYHSVNYEHNKWGRVSRWLLRLSERLSLRYCDRVIFVNRLRMSLFDDDYPDKCVYLPNGVDLVEPTTETDFLDKHGIKPRHYVLAVGRISPEKGFEHLVKAVNASDSVECLVIAGQYDHNDSYLKKLKALDIKQKMVLTGYAGGDDLNQLYSHARLFVLPSVNEGFPMVLLEAMAYGLPILCSDIPGTRQVDLPEQDYFTVRDVDSLCAAITRHLEGPNEPQRYDLEPYNWDAIAQQTRRCLLNR